jgi:hypothetical protein
MRFKTITEFIAALDIAALDDGADDSVDIELNIDIEAPDRFAAEEHGGNGRRIAALVVLAGLLGGAGYQYGFLDPVIELIEAEFGERRIVVIESVEPESVAAESVGLGSVDPDSAEPEIAEPDAAVNETTELLVDEKANREPEDQDIEAPVKITAPVRPLVDFSKLPAANAVVQLSLLAGESQSVSVTLRENGRPVIVDFVRDGDLSNVLTLRLEEVGFTGNRSPWAGGQYALSEAGMVRFPVGQERGRVTMTMASDPLREADQQSTLRLREADSVDSELALINVTLEDDDQRAFESRLPVNTIAFAASQASIRETDPAVQIDLVRFNPDNSPLVVDFAVNDITATEGEDYFAPGSFTISFGPKQRSARLLIPLVQDSDVEGNEAFVVELIGTPETSSMEIYTRIVVMIRDDEPHTP